MIRAVCQLYPQGVLHETCLRNDEGQPKSSKNGHIQGSLVGKQHAECGDND